MLVDSRQLEAFRVQLETFLLERHVAERHFGAPPAIEMNPGPKYARIVVTRNGQRSCYGFLNLHNGDLLKFDSWKNPAQGARGNIFSATPLAGCTLYGVASRR